MKNLLRIVALAWTLLWASPVLAATCFWVGGVGNWDNTNQASWSSSSGGAGSTCAATGGIPKNAGDIATFDGSSGGGTVTVCGAASANCPTSSGVVSLAQITMGAFTGTLDFSAINPNVTLTKAFSITGTGTRTLNCGSGTYTLSATSGTLWDIATGTNLTLSCASATLAFTAASPIGTRTFNTGGRSYGTITLSAATSPTATAQFSTSGSPTFGTFNITGPNNWNVGTGNITITNGFNWVQASSAAPLLINGGAGSTITSANNGSMSWVMLFAVTFAGGGTFTATNSLTLTPTTGITITPPSAGGGRIIGG